MYIDITL